MLMRFDRANPQIAVTSDASGIWGCGAYEGDKWQFAWPTTTEDSHISVRETIPVVMAAAQYWTGKSVRFFSDAVVALINSGSSREKHLMRCLTFIMPYNFVASGAHIRGIHNDFGRRVIP